MTTSMNLNSNWGSRQEWPCYSFVSDLYSPQDKLYNKDEFVDGDADRSGHAIPLPPDSYSICKMSNISAHPKLKSLLHVNSRCKGSRLLFEFLLGSSQVVPYEMKNHLEYTVHSNPVFIVPRVYDFIGTFYGRILNSFIPSY